MLLALSACSDDKNIAASAPLTEPSNTHVKISNIAAKLDTVSLEQTSYKKALQFHGIVKGIHSYNETIFESGKIIQLDAKEGQSVQSGQLIAKLYSPILAEKLDQAYAVLKKSQAELSLSQQTLARNNTLFAKKLIAQQLLDEAKRDHNIATQAKNEAQAMVAQAKMSFPTQQLKRKAMVLSQQFISAKVILLAPAKRFFGLSQRTGKKSVF